MIRPKVPSRRLCLLLILFYLLGSNAGCYTYSEGRDNLAKSIQERYGSITPAGLETLESLDKDLERLIASKKNDYELLKETNGTALVGMTWEGLITRVSSADSNLRMHAENIAKGKKVDEKTAAELKKRIDKLRDKLDEMEEAIAKIENKKTLAERLNESEAVISQITGALKTLIPAGDASPVDARLSTSVGDLTKYLDSVKGDRSKTEQTYSLILEALRLGRDVAELELESLQQEYNFRERRLAFFQAEEKLVKQRDWVPQMLTALAKYPRQEFAKNRIAMLAADPNAGDELPMVLQQLGLLQTLEITTDSRLKELELRREVEGYRNARLLDAVYERQRMALISYGLEGVVRYSQGGLRTQDISRLINIAQTIAQVVIAVRV